MKKKAAVIEHTIRCLVIDTETTGMAETDQVCEVAGVNVNTHFWKDTGQGGGVPATRGRAWTTLVKPSCPVSAEGRAAHHITDAELADAPTFERLLELSEVMGGGLADLSSSQAREHVVLVAHNLEFDLRLLKQSGLPDSMLPDARICTVRCARHMFPQYRASNQVLRYELNLDVPPLTGPMHRALPDAQVTASLLMHMLTIHDVDQLVHLTTAPLLMTTCNMGEHAGKPWSEVDVGFLRWLLAKGPRRTNPRGGRDIGFDDDTRNTAQHWLNQKTGRMI